MVTVVTVVTVVMMVVIHLGRVMLERVGFEIALVTRRPARQLAGHRKGQIHPGPPVVTQRGHGSLPVGQLFLLGHQQVEDIVEHEVDAFLHALQLDFAGREQFVALGAELVPVMGQPDEVLVDIGGHRLFQFGLPGLAVLQPRLGPGDAGLVLVEDRQGEGDATTPKAGAIGLALELDTGLDVTQPPIAPHQGHALGEPLQGVIQGPQVQPLFQGLFDQGVAVIHSGQRQRQLAGNLPVIDLAGQPHQVGQSQTCLAFTLTRILELQSGLCRADAQLCPLQVGDIAGVIKALAQQRTEIRCTGLQCLHLSPLARSHRVIPGTFSVRGQGHHPLGQLQTGGLPVGFGYVLSRTAHQQAGNAPGQANPDFVAATALGAHHRQ